MLIGKTVFMVCKGNTRVRVLMKDGKEGSDRVFPYGAVYKVTILDVFRAGVPSYEVKEADGRGGIEKVVVKPYIKNQYTIVYEAEMGNHDFRRTGEIVNIDPTVCRLFHSYHLCRAQLTLGESSIPRLILAKLQLKFNDTHRVHDLMDINSMQRTFENSWFDWTSEETKELNIWLKENQFGFQVPD